MASVTATAAALTFGLLQPERAGGLEGRDAAGPLDLLKAKIDQRKKQLRIDLRVGGPMPQLRTLRRYPARLAGGERRYLCLTFQSPRLNRRLVCPGGKAVGNRVRVGVSRLYDSGRADKRHGEWARFRKPGPRRLQLTMPLADLDLEPGRVYWTARSGWRGEQCRPEPPPEAADRREKRKSRRRRARAAAECADRLPDRGWRRYRIAPLIAVGCTRPRSPFVSHGPRGKSAVALTFDDGPARSTRKVIETLERYDARGTFFVNGSSVPGGAAAMRRALRGGHELGNHSMHHEMLPASVSMRRTNRLIKRHAGFRPCLFRAPYGLLNSSTILAARSNGMSTIHWDVDPRDWTTPGARTIASRVLAGARGGSIVVMHDGPGDRSQTVAALPRIIKKLRSRGLRLVTVTELLGGRFKVREDRRAAGSSRR